MKITGSVGALVWSALAIVSSATRTGLVAEVKPNWLLGNQVVEGDEVSSTAAVQDATPPSSSDALTEVVQDATPPSSSDALTEVVQDATPPSSSDALTEIVSDDEESAVWLAGQSVSKGDARPVPWMFLSENATAKNLGVEMMADSTTTTTPTSTCFDPSAFTGAAAKVLIVISSCIDTTATTGELNKWLTQLKNQEYKYFDGDKVREITFDKYSVADGPPGRECSGTTTTVRLPTIPIADYVAVVSLATNQKMAATIANLVRGTSTKVIGINVNTDRSVTLNNYLRASATATSFLEQVNLFTVARAMYCNSLVGGVATSYIDASTGNRKCFCSCPTGYTEKNGKCEKDAVESCDCAWKGRSFKFESTDTSSCSISSLSKGPWNLPVPVASDNYVAHMNANAEGPKVEVKVTKSGETSTPYTFPWTKFVENSAAQVDTIKLTSVGKYTFELTASDYDSSSAPCSACVVVVDGKRPSSSGCASSADRTECFTDRRAAQDALQTMTAFQRNVQNDKCSEDRNDKISSTVTSIDGVTATAADDTYMTALNDDLLALDLDEKLKKESSPSDSCTRCATVETVLREYVTHYTCDPRVTPYRELMCGGSCSLKRCITVKGDDLATPKAVIKPDVLAKSATVLKAKDKDAIPSNTDVHIALDCSKDLARSLLAAKDGPEEAEVCSITKKVSEFVDVWATSKTDFFTNDKMNSYVSWEYSVGGDWKPFKTETAETFTNSETTISIRAKSNCGSVGSTFTFFIHLHVNNEIDVCTHFPGMWNQALVAPKISPNSYCMYPNSDFAEVTFDYHPNIGIEFKTDKFKMSIDSVLCTLQYGGEEGDAGAVKVLEVKTAPYEIVKQFAIDGAVKATTTGRTMVKARCQFTYKSTIDNKPVKHTCTHDLAITDCSPPGIDKPCELSGKCDLNKCAKEGKPDRDIYQACGGYRVYQESSTKTAMTDGETDEPCCKSCTSREFDQPTCQLISPFPARAKYKYIKRCEPTKKDDSDDSHDVYHVQLEAAEDKDGAYTNISTMATWLMGASAMVAVVALVVVRRRREVKPAMEDDAYYALLG